MRINSELEREERVQEDYSYQRTRKKRKIIIYIYIYIHIYIHTYIYTYIPAIHIFSIVIIPVLSI